MPDIEVGVIKNEPNEIQNIEWTIPDFFSVIIDTIFGPYVSPWFSYGGISWHLRLYPKNDTIYFRTKTKREFSVEYCLGLKKDDGSEEQFTRGILDKDMDCGNETIKFIRRSELLNRKSQLVPSDILIMTCVLRVMAEHNQPPGTKSLKLKKIETLSENFKNLSINKIGWDVTLYVKEKEYKAHKAVLIARSTVFAGMFQHETSEKQTGIITIPDCDPESFGIFLDFLYSGKLDELSPSKALHLYETSEKYNIQELKEFCTECLLNNLTIENVLDVVIIADMYDDTKLSTSAQVFFNHNLNKVLMTSEWDCFLDNYRRLAKKLLLEMSTKMKASE